MSALVAKLLETLRCPACRECLSKETGRAGADFELMCGRCGERYPVLGSVPRLLVAPMRAALFDNQPTTESEARLVQTARSFGFEWSRFPEMYEEWKRSFLAYMYPHGAEFFRGKKMLDAGCGSGRFAYYAAKYGAEVWAIDLGSAVEVAHKNTQGAGSVHVVQADLYRPPFAYESFDFIYSIGVLHHLPDPEGAFQNLLRFLRPGGEIQIYLYWKPEQQPVKSTILALVTAVRKLTTRLPYPVVYALSYPAAAAAFAFFVWPYKILRRIRNLAGLAEQIPMKQYAHFPFRVCVNDQLDRLSAPIENRYTRAEVQQWLTRAQLEEIEINPNFGWVGTGRKPARAQTARHRSE